MEELLGVTGSAKPLGPGVVTTTAAGGARGPTRPIVRSSVRRNERWSAGALRSDQSVSPFTHAASRAFSTFHIASTSSSRPSDVSTAATGPVTSAGFTRASVCSSNAFTRRKSRRSGDLRRGSSPSSCQVWTSATGRSRLMWAFIPASAKEQGRRGGRAPRRAAPTRALRRRSRSGARRARRSRGSQRRRRARAESARSRTRAPRPHPRPPPSRRGTGA